MIFGLLTLLIAFTIAGVAAWFSIVGLMAIFSAAALPIAVMASTLEIAKLFTASWLYRYWNDTKILLKSYLFIAVVVLMIITSMGIFGYLSKAHLDQASTSGTALAQVERLNEQIAREENKITIIEERKSRIVGGTVVDNSSNIQQQERIRTGAWDRVQGDIQYNQDQIGRIQDRLTKDLSTLDEQENALNRRLADLDSAVTTLRNRGVETVTTTEENRRRERTDVVNYVEEAEKLRKSQQSERNEIASSKSSLQEQRDKLRNDSQKAIQPFQANIERYRQQAQKTIDEANREINILRRQSTSAQDDNLEQIDTYDEQIDNIYDEIVVLKEQLFEAEGKVRHLEQEFGPIKYVAQLVFGGDDRDSLDKAVQMLMLMLIFAFDPLAVVLVLAANQTLMQHGIRLEKSPSEEENKDLKIDSEKEENNDNKELVDLLLQLNILKLEEEENKVEKEPEINIEEVIQEEQEEQVSLETPEILETAETPNITEEVVKYISTDLNKPKEETNRTLQTDNTTRRKNRKHWLVPKNN